MTLSSGVRVGPYEILSPLGAGGMGEVYRARDTKLQRDVALKVLPALFTADADRLARFKREAQVLASLNHPNIGAIYGFEESSGVQALVLELVEGPTLAARIARGVVPLNEALPIARQVVEALEAAHERGIIHRDLKPSNIAFTADNRVKVLDFGLAKAFEPTLRGGDVSQSPTITSPAMTRAGVIVGTAAYMSPEQARGRPVDKRADIWAFGSVLYELLSGNRAFPGDDATETIAAVVRAEPDWRALPADTPPAIQRLLRRCLEKDPSDRLHDISDARLEITEAMRAPVDRTPAGASPVLLPTRRPRSAPLAWSVATVGLLATITLTWALWFRAAPTDARVYRSSILLPAGLSSFASTRLAVSPDGRYLAFVAPDATGRVLLWVRELEGLVARPLVGTDGAVAPFWSPDSRFLAFVASNSLKKIDVAGGPPLTLGEASVAVPGTWNQDDVIVYTPATGSPLVRVSAAGGTPSPVTTVDAHGGEATHAFPFFLPDGQHFLYLAQSSGGFPRGVYVGSLISKERTRVLEGGSNAQYADGHLIFLRGTTLMAQPFDVTRLALTGNAVPLADQVQISEATASIRAGAFAVSHTGVLIYQAGSVASRLVWFDRGGTQVDTLGDRANYADVRLSPDGTHVSVSVAEEGAATRDIWDMDVARGLRTRFTFDPEDEWESLRSPDGSRLVFNSRRKGHMDLYSKAASGAGREEVLLEDGVDKYPQSWSPDGRFILYVTGGTTGQDLWILPLGGDRKPWPFLQTKFSEGTGQFSPDGRWVAYRSDESGRFEVYVAPFPGPGGKWQISTSGGNVPRWRRDGHEIFYTVPGTNKLMAASVTGEGAGFEVGRVRPLFDLRPRLLRWFYDVSPDGQRFLVNTPEGQAESAPITIVVNWPAALKK